MANYNNFYFECPSISNKLKPIVCQSCLDNGDVVGTCSKCLENQAYNREWLETNAFVYDTTYRHYHADRHMPIKTLPLRIPNEHPYLYYGIELEVEFDRGMVEIYNTSSEDEYDNEYDESDNWKIQEILDEFSEITDGLFVYEADSSLTNGVECISRPCSYAYWTHKDTVERLRKGLEFLREKGALVKQPDTNGLHIHISRKFFDHGNTKLSDRNLAYQGFDWLFQKFQPEFEKLGGRKYTQFCEAKADKLRKSMVDDNWRFRSYNVEAEIKCVLKKGGELARGDHYSAVNITSNTIEARVFKSTTDYKHILADIEMVRNLAHAVREEDIEKTLNDILHTKDNLFLDEYINKVRRECAKNNEKLDLDKMNDNKIEVVVKETTAQQ